MSSHIPKPPVHPDRDQLFGNEAFVIGMLQAVSGGSVVAAIAQIEPITTNAGLLAFLIFVTIMSFALVAAVLAAYLRHQYKMWDVKGHANQANRGLRAMRRSMLLAACFVIAGVVELVASFWYAYLHHGLAA
jgi:hypothetical protein